MAENKKYYFLKLKEDFFDQREIVVLEGSKDGVLYVNILLKLYLKSLQHNGKLLLNEMTPLSAEMIALLTRHEIGTVERAIRAFMQLGLVEVLEDNTYYMPEIQEMTGKASSDAERKARYRRLRSEGKTPLLTDKNTGIEQNWDNVPPVSQFSRSFFADSSIHTIRFCSLLLRLLSFDFSLCIFLAQTGQYFDMPEPGTYSTLHTVQCLAGNAVHRFVGVICNSPTKPMHL